MPAYPVRAPTEEELAEARARNGARQFSMITTAKRGSSTASKAAQQKITQVQSAIKQMIKVFLREIREGLIYVDYTSKEVINRRKSQLQILKDTMTVLRQLKEMQAELEEAIDAQAAKADVDEENEQLLAQAEELLKTAGAGRKEAE